MHFYTVYLVAYNNVVLTGLSNKDILLNIQPRSLLIIYDC